MPRVRFSPYALGATLHRWGGSGGSDDPLTGCVTDFVPLGVEGDDKQQLIHVNVMPVAATPPAGSRSLPTSINAFRDPGSGICHGAVCRATRVARELYITVRTLYERGMPVSVACHLHDQLISSAWSPFTRRPAVGSLLSLGRTPSATSRERAYEEQGWGVEETTFIVRPEPARPPFGTTSPCKAAAMSDALGTRRQCVALSLTGVEKPVRSPPSTRKTFRSTRSLLTTTTAGALGAGGVY